MAAQKTLINSTGNVLKVVLIVRKGDHPTDLAGMVEVELTAGPDETTGENRSAQTVSYGNDVDIFLNGLEATLQAEGKEEVQRRVILDRGSRLDNTLNMNNTIEFLYDGHTVLFSGSNTDGSAEEGHGAS